MLSFLIETDWETFFRYDNTLLYLSLYFKTHREQYYDLLQRVRTERDWRGWLEFFLTGINSTAEQAAQTAARLLRLFDEDRHRIQGIGRPSGSALRVHNHLKDRPLATVQTAAKALKLTEPTVRVSLEHLVKLGIAKEISGRRRGKLFAYDAYVKILSGAPSRCNKETSNPDSHR